jgi:excisionase family DNA binding protein
MGTEETGDDIMTADGLKTTEELSRQLKVSIPTLRRWRAEGKGPRALKIGRQVRYRESDIEAFLQRQSEPVE